MDCLNRKCSIIVFCCPLWPDGRTAARFFTSQRSKDILFGLVWTFCTKFKKNNGNWLTFLQILCIVRCPCPSCKSNHLGTFWNSRWEIFIQFTLCRLDLLPFPYPWLELLPVAVAWKTESATEERAGLEESGNHNHSIQIRDGVGKPGWFRHKRERRCYTVWRMGSATDDCTPSSAFSFMPKPTRLSCEVWEDDTTDLEGHGHTHF